jgi:hypothetical protein
MKGTLLTEVIIRKILKAKFLVPPESEKWEMSNFHDNRYRRRAIKSRITEVQNTFPTIK